MTPMKIFPAVHYSMGGLWADYEAYRRRRVECQSRPATMLTNIPGLYAIGECNYQYHGANRLGANSLLSCIFDGLIVAPGIETLLKSLSSCAGRSAGLAVRQTRQATPGRSTISC